MISLKKILEWFFPKVSHVPSSVTSPLIQVPTINNPTGDWTQYLSLPYDIQWGGTFDEDNCDVMGALESIEPLLNWLIKNPSTQPELIQGLKDLKFINSQGFVKLSPRFTSVMAGVKEGIGVSMSDVWKSIMNDGVVPYEVYPDPVAPFDWNTYMQPIDPKIIAFGKQFLTLLQFNYSWVNDGNCQPNIQTLQNALKQAPLHLCGPVCTKDQNGIEQPCGTCVCQHCRTIYKISDYTYLLDHYSGTFLEKISLNCSKPFIILPEVKII